MKNIYDRVSLRSKRKGYDWQTAIGLQEVGGLKTFGYLREIACQHFEWDITIEEVKHWLLFCTLEMLLLVPTIIYS